MSAELAGLDAPLHVDVVEREALGRDRRTRRSAVSPGASVTRWKPFSSFTGRVTRADAGRGCTAARPRRRRAGRCWSRRPDTRVDSPARDRLLRRAGRCSKLNVV
ncbi:MAG: hypothetical protein MZV63_15950 [Marinilabiliales bacterium]|nr:hypothetical protein [Marinilabiliales bacterium]